YWRDGPLRPAGRRGAARLPDLPGVPAMRSALRSVRAAAQLVPALALTLALGACGGGESAYCNTLTENSEVAATVYGPVVPGQADAAQIDRRLDLLTQDADDVPEDLEDHFATWTAYLQEVQPLLDSGDMDAVLEAMTDEVDVAGAALFEHYTGTCMD